MRHRFAPVVVTLLALALAAPLLAACSKSNGEWHSTDMTGSLPALDFTMTRAADGKTVTASDFTGKVTLLYFGYTFCPDVCPLTLSNLARSSRSSATRRRTCACSSLPSIRTATRFPC